MVHFENIISLSGLDFSPIWIPLISKRLQTQGQITESGSKPIHVHCHTQVVVLG